MTDHIFASPLVQTRLYWNNISSCTRLVTTDLLCLEYFFADRNNTVIFIVLLKNVDICNMPISHDVRFRLFVLASLKYMMIKVNLRIKLRYENKQLNAYKYCKIGKVLKWFVSIDICLWLTYLVNLIYLDVELSSLLLIL